MNEIDYVVEYYKLKRQLVRQERYYLLKLMKQGKEIEKLKNYIKHPVNRQDNDLNNVLSAVSQISDVLREDIIGRSRQTDISNARHLFCYIAYIYHRHSLSKIGEFLIRDHSTVINSIKQFSNYLDCGYAKEKRQLKQSLELLSIDYEKGKVPRNDLSEHDGRRRTI